MLKRRSARVRSAPAYISLGDGDEVVSLVLEGEAVGEDTGEKINTTAVYVIDNGGVHRFDAQPGRLWAAMALVALGACLQYAFQRLTRRASK